MLSLENDSKSFWTRTKDSLFYQTSIQNEACIKAEFQKKGRLLQGMVWRTYYLFRYHLFYGSSNHNSQIQHLKGYVYLPLIYADFFKEDGKYYIRLNSMNNSLTIFTCSQTQYEIWRDELSQRCILLNFASQYKTGHLLGNGNFSTVKILFSYLKIYFFLYPKVFQCEKINDESKVYAVKKISKKGMKHSKVIKEQLINEIISLRILRHETIIKLFEVYDTDNNIYLVTELLSGGDLIQRQSKFKLLTLEQLRIIMLKLLNCVQYIHSKDIIHRDIKPSNILFKDQNDPTQVCLIDFGLSALLQFQKYGHIKCGSVGYTAPEILNYIEGKKLYSNKCDIYSLGITFFILTFGYNPFLGDDYTQTHRLNKESYIYFPQRTGIPPQVYNLLEMMLKRNPKERYSAEDALNDCFFNEQIQKNIYFKLPKMIYGKKLYDRRFKLNNDFTLKSSQFLGDFSEIKDSGEEENKNQLYKQNRIQECINVEFTADQAIALICQTRQKALTFEDRINFHSSLSNPKQQVQDIEYKESVKNPIKSQIKLQSNILFTSDNLSTVHSQIFSTEERIKKFRLIVSQSAFQKYKQTATQTKNKEV